MSPYAGSRQRVLQLYRQIMKLGRGWGHSGEEQRYIFKEAQQAFKGNKTTSEALDIDEQIREGEMRLQYARQWGIPYPRLEHKDQSKYIRKPSSDSAGDAPVKDPKLAAAMARRRQKMQGHDPSG